MIGPGERAEAHALAFRILARLFGGGPAAVPRAELDQSLVLSDAIATYADFERLEADHQGAFGMQVFPNAGSFLAPDGLAGGPVADRIAGLAYELAVEQRTPADHLSTLCLQLAEGCEREARLWTIGEPLTAGAQAEQGARFLDGALLCWLPQFTLAVYRLGRPWPTALVSLLEDLCLVRREALGRYDLTPFELPPPDLDLDDPRTDLRRIGEWLCTPARCGIFLSKRDIGRLARRFELPRGFGGRSQILINTLRAAARFDAIGAVFEALEDLIDAADRALADPSRARIAALVDPWRGRLDWTRAQLGRIRAAAEAACDTDSSPT